MPQLTGKRDSHYFSDPVTMCFPSSHSLGLAPHQTPFNFITPLYFSASPISGLEVSFPLLKKGLFGFQRVIITHLLFFVKSSYWISVFQSKACTWNFVICLLAVFIRIQTPVNLPFIVAFVESSFDCKGRDQI